MMAHITPDHYRLSRTAREQPHDIRAMPLCDVGKRSRINWPALGMSAVVASCIVGAGAVGAGYADGVLAVLIALALIILAGLSLWLIVWTLGPYAPRDSDEARDED